MVVVTGSSFVVLFTRRDLALLVPHRRSAATRRGIEVPNPVTGDLVALVIGEREGDAVGALQFDVLAGENKVRRLGRGSGGDSGWFRVDVDVDGVGYVLDRGGVWHWERRLISHERRDDALEEDVGVDQGDSAER